MNAIRSDKGITLIEVVIAIGVLAFGILSLMVLYTTGLKGFARSQALSEEIMYGSGLVEQLVSLPYNAADLSVGPNNFFIDSNNDGRLADELKDCVDSTSPPSGADHCQQYSSGSIYWNIIEDSPIPYTKRIQILITHKKSPAEVVLEYVKSYQL